MSAIDQYKHKLLGFIECPSSFDIVPYNSTRKAAVYELLENIPDDEKDFDGKVGDILLGGGSGEVAALRISIPQAMVYFFDDWVDFEDLENPYKAFWSPTESYVFGDGYSKLGWNPDYAIDDWVAKNLCIVLIERFDHYKIYKTAVGFTKSTLTFSEKF
ncbi:MAG: hypothetical protein ACXVAY_03950 [Mucilaginibacter sp.]